MFLVIFINGRFLVNDLIFELEFAVGDGLGILVFWKHAVTKGYRAIKI